MFHRHRALYGQHACQRVHARTGHRKFHRVYAFIGQGAFDVHLESIRHRGSYRHRAIYAFTALWLIAAPAGAQISLSGQVVDAEHAAVAYANVQLLTFADSAFVLGGIAEEDGSFLLGPIRPGDYRLFVSLIGFEDYVSERFSLSVEGRHDAGVVVLRRTVLEMDEVSVEARRVVYEQRGDRLIVNLGGVVSAAGRTALDVLERSPGVVVNRSSGTITLIGKDGAEVMVDGKRSYVPSSGLIQYLAGISADNVEAIELITSPPAGMDAEGNAGFINIVMKESHAAGLSGSLAASAGYGDGEIGSVSATVDYHTGRFSLLASYSGLRNGQRQYATQYRRIENADGIVETPTSVRRDPLRSVHNARLALDYTLGRRTAVGALVGAFDNRWTMDALNVMHVQTNGTSDFRIDSHNDELNHWRHAMGSAYVKRTFSAGSTVRADVDYVYYHDNNPTEYLNVTSSAGGAGSTEETFQSTKRTPIRFLVAKVDYTSGTTVRLETGIKAAFSQLTNDTGFEGLVRDEWLDAAGLVSKSTLHEDVLAAYAGTSFPLTDSTTAKIGLRYEHTASNLESGTGSDLVDRRYGSLFPSASLSHKLGASRQIDASYTRRITRPSFTDMAPFLYFIDPQTFITGNTGLQPAIINALKVDVTLDDLLMSAQYSWEDHSIARFQSRILPEENIQILFAQNLERIRTGTVLLAMPLYPAAWWSSQNNVTGSWTEVVGVRDDIRVRESRASVRIQSTQSISLPRDFDFEASGFYQSPTYNGLLRFDSLWRVDLAVRKILPNDYGTLTLAANDVFDSNDWRFQAGSSGEAIFFEAHWDLFQPSVQLTYSVRFGGGEARSRRSTASAEEQERVG